MKKFFLALVIFSSVFCGTTAAQTSRTGRIDVGLAAALPATCSPGDVYLPSDAPVINTCNAAGNGWNTEAFTNSGNTFGSTQTFNNIAINGTCSGIGCSSNLATDNTWTNNNRFKGPIPFRDATAYGAFSSTATYGATCNSGSPNVTLTTTYSTPSVTIGDWKNGQYISLYGCGALATVTAPNLTPISITSIARSSNVVTATVSSIGPIQTSSYVQVASVTDSSYNGLFFTTGGNGTTTLTWNQTGANSSSSGGTVNQGVAIYEGTNPGSTTYTYNVCAVGHGGGCSAKSATLTVTNGPATITELDNIWLNFGVEFPGALYTVDYLCVYRNNSFIGRSYMAGYNDDGVVWGRNLNCPATPPASATADLLKTHIVSGAGTVNLVVADNAGTSNTLAFTFHDSAIPIQNAAAAVHTDGPSGFGGPSVFLPAGHYLTSWLNLGNSGASEYTLDVTGILELTTHPIMMSGGASFIGHGLGTVDEIYFNTDNQTEVQKESTWFYDPQSLRNEMDGFAIQGGNSTVRGIFQIGPSHDYVFVATPTTGTSSITLENTSGFHTTAGDCIYANANVIFAKIYNFRCNAASVELGAPANRYSIYFTNVWNSGGNVSVDWELRDLGLNYGAIKVESPAPNAGQGIAGWKFGKIQQVFTESIRSKGFYTVDGGCSTSPYDTRVVVAQNIQDFFVYSDQAAYKGLYFYNRAGTTGCTAPNIGLVGSDMWMMARGGDPTVGANVPLPTASLSVSPWDGSILNSDTDLNLQETRIGALRTVIGGNFYMRCVQGSLDVPCGAIMMTPPDFFISDGGPGGSCGAGITYYFALSASDGIGFTKVGMQTREQSASTGAGGEIITLNFLPGYSAIPKFRVWYGTTSGGENNYFDTTNTSSFNFVCGAPTGSGTPPTTTTAYWMKFASESGLAGWYGLSKTDLFGIGKSNPAVQLDVAGQINADLGVVGLVDGHPPVTITTVASCTLGTTSGCNATAYNSGYTYNQDATAGAAITYTLPTAAVGHQYCVANSDVAGTPDTGTLKLATSASGQFIHYNGSRSATGGYIISAGAAGDKACVVGITTTDWEFYPQVGTWTLH